MTNIFSKICSICGGKTQHRPWCETMKRPPTIEEMLECVKNETESTDKGNALTAKHYQTADIQPIEIMQMYFTKEEMIGFLRGNILKYNLRYGNKDIPEKEAAKIVQYSAWLEDVENGRKIDPRKGEN